MFVSDPMGVVREDWSGVAGEDRSSWSAAARSARLLELLELRERVDAEVVRCAAEWDAVSAWAEDAALSAPAWLAARAPVTRPAAARPAAARPAAAQLVCTARFVRAHDTTAQALVAGDVSVAHVEVLASVAHGRTELYGEHEDTLLTAAGALVPDDLVTVARRWRELADHELARDDAAANFERRHLHVSPTLGGGVIDGFLDPGATATVVRALDALEGPDPTGGAFAPRSLSQRRADALVSLCEESLSFARRGGRAPLAVDVIVDLETLLDRGPVDLLAARSEILGRGPLAKTAVERILCDSPIGRVIMRGRSEVLDLGRRSRVVSPTLRRAVTIRDEHCVFPRCRAPSPWCDVHHLEHWLDDGETNEANCVLLCRRHHVACHEGGWKLARGPDGTQLALAA
jgi:Domain of unknown function (DUF222)